MLIFRYLGYIEYRDERRQRGEEKKTNDIYANCLDQFGGP